VPASKPTTKSTKYPRAPARRRLETVVEATIIGRTREREKWRRNKMAVASPRAPHARTHERTNERKSCGGVERRVAYSEQNRIIGRAITDGTGGRDATAQKARAGTPLEGGVGVGVGRQKGRGQHEKCGTNRESRKKKDMII
jgi:hypothetical protein